MKKIFYIFVLLMLTLSCTNTESEALHEVSISFSPVVYQNTRTSDANIYPQDTPFGVWAYSLPTNSQWRFDASSASVFMNNEKVSYKSGSWLPSATYHWTSDKLLTFFAYSPASIQATYNLENGITIPDYDIKNGTDLYYTRPLTDVNNLYNQGCISLPFVSAFAKVNFRARSMVMAGRKVHLKRLYMDDLAHKGTFRLRPDERWITTDDRTDVDFFIGDTVIESRSMDIGTLAVMPQLPNQPVRMLVDIYTDEGNLLIPDRVIKSTKLSNRWQPGKYYSYTLNIYSDSITFTSDIINEL